MTLYVVTKHIGRLLQQENICVTGDIDLAVNKLNFAYNLEETEEAFIEVWEKGEKQYVTREDPRKL
jgi:hypothetical protein